MSRHKEAAFVLVAAEKQVGHQIETPQFYPPLEGVRLSMVTEYSHSEFVLTVEQARELGNTLFLQAGLV